MTKDQILELTSAADLVSSGNLIALIYPYNPYNSQDGILELDSYYIASHAAYKAAKAANIGTLTNDINIKRFLMDRGLKISRSSLVIHPKYGSYFLVQALRCNFPIEDISINSEPLYCDNCNICISACPSKAISKHVYTRNKCIRDMMDHDLSAENLQFYGNDLLGCQICRKVCPHNKDIRHVEMPHDLSEKLKLETLLCFDKETQETLVKYIGKNMARASVLLPQVMVAAAKSTRTDLRHLIVPLTRHPSIKVANAAKLILHELT